MTVDVHPEDCAECGRKPCICADRHYLIELTTVELEGLIDCFARRDRQGAIELLRGANARYGRETRTIPAVDVVGDDDA